jgi:chloramphenicol O-acetyltransferase type A
VKRAPATPRVIELDSWPRRPQFEFFREFEMPFWNVTFEVDVSDAVDASRRPGEASFFLRSLHASQCAAQATPELRQRLRPDGVVEYPTIHCGSTFLRDDETFAFAYFDFDPDLATFAAAAQVELEAARREPPGLRPLPERDDLIHYSVLPWVTFSSFAHARRLPPFESVPKIVFGRHVVRVTPRGERRLMPVSIEVHHALADGLHVGRYVERFEQALRSSGAG